MYKVEINKNEYPVTFKDNHVLLDGKKESWDLIHIKSNQFHLIKDHKTYHIEVLRVDQRHKTIELRINDRKFSATIKDKFDQLLEKLGMNQSNGSRVNLIKAPMPGLILEVCIKEGDQVVEGDKLMVLEAMKMENVIKCPSDGLIKSVAIKQGDRVEKNQTLIEL
ncbi:MAG: acetyl-CoA carboxylase biotin carboxyl carrier protein subunit [Cyclobacteriaceae bacterium]